MSSVFSTYNQPGADYHVTPISIIDGGSSELQCDSAGNLRVVFPAAQSVNATCSGTIAISSISSPVTVASVTNPITVSQTQWLPFTNFGTSIAFVIKTSPGFSGGAYLTSTAGIITYFQLFNKITAPVNGDVPVWSIQMLTSDGHFLYDSSAIFGASGLQHGLGISAGWSSTQSTFTAVTGTNIGKQSTSLGYR